MPLPTDKATLPLPRPLAERITCVCTERIVVHNKASSQTFVAKIELHLFFLNVTTLFKYVSWF